MVGQLTGVMNDLRIAELAYEKGMIEPFVDTQIRSHSITGEKFISYGLSSFGYDIRVGSEFKLFTNIYPCVIDPKQIGEMKFIEHIVAPHQALIIPPNAFALAHSVEYLRIPRNVIGICLGKSTYARCGLVANITALEPEWEGQLTIELSNTSPMPVKVYAQEGIAQLILFEGQNCRRSYSDKNGKYNKQTGITLPKV